MRALRSMLFFLLAHFASAATAAEMVGGHEFVRLPAGKFLMGIGDSVPAPWNKYKWDYPLHEVEVAEFAIGKYPVTVAEFGAFLNAKGFTPDLGDGKILLQHFTEKGGKFVPKEKFKPFPIAGVTYQGAVSYCEWFGKKHGKAIRLPTEAEWEYAARGASGRTYPWGEKVISKLPIKCAVGQYPDLATPEGVHDLIGPVYQWCLDSFDEDFYKSGPLRDPVSRIGEQKVIRGYAASQQETMLEQFLYAPPAWRRYSALPGRAGEHFGFRMIMHQAPY